MQGEIISLFTDWRNKRSQLETNSAAISRGRFEDCRVLCEIQGGLVM